MELPENVGGNDRRARAALAALLTVAAVRAFRSGKRKRALLVAGGALVAGFTAVTKHCPANARLGIDTAEGIADIDIEDRSDLVADSDTASIDETATDDTETVTVAVGGDGETATQRGQLTCAFCGEPIVPGQRRSPNAQGDIVHDSCE
ncbi:MULTISPECIES: YgaP-like transmembrane domain [Haloarcula]|uniref:YgaP-like transmembrane domain n=1 Tax=Haloarcula TaxID=2237 RepID=UPI0023ED53AA|nr:YgaP-like transmembrane domain [Halomicroarcula sp. XH51]